MTPMFKQIADLFYPLSDFYASHGVTLPSVVPIEGKSIPSPYRELLVHEQDMTSKLETYWKSPLSVKVLEKHEEPSQLTRQVVLVTDSGKPTEFGAIRINLDSFSPDARVKILACEKPLGALLKDHGMAFRCRPNAFFSFACDEIARQAFHLGQSHTLYGRHNILMNDQEETLAEVVEILPPLEEEFESR
jgi:hypothetical protein